MGTKRADAECIRMGAGKEQSVSFRAQTKPLRVLARKANLGRIACREPVVMWDLLESDMRSDSESGLWLRLLEHLAAERHVLSPSSQQQDRHSLFVQLICTPDPIDLAHGVSI